MLLLFDHPKPERSSGIEIIVECSMPHRQSACARIRVPHFLRRGKTRGYWIRSIVESQVYASNQPNLEFPIENH